MGDKGRGPEARTLCHWKPGQYDKERELLAKIVGEPVFYCADCGRVAAKKKWLCEPARLVRDE